MIGPKKLSTIRQELLDGAVPTGEARIAAAKRAGTASGGESEVLLCLQRFLDAPGVSGRSKRRVGKRVERPAFQIDKDGTMHEQIRQALAAATADGHKLATFHYEVLAHAPELDNADAEEFCRAVDVPASYQTEFRKMLALARLIRERGLPWGK